MTRGHDLRSGVAHQGDRDDHRRHAARRARAARARRSGGALLAALRGRAARRRSPCASCSRTTRGCRPASIPARTGRATPARSSASKALAPVATARARFVYSDLNFIVLGELVRRVTRPGSTRTARATCSARSGCATRASRRRPSATASPRRSARGRRAGARPDGAAHGRRRRACGPVLHRRRPGDLRRACCSTAGARETSRCSMPATVARDDGAAESRRAPRRTAASAGTSTRRSPTPGTTCCPTAPTGTRATPARRCGSTRRSRTFVVVLTNRVRRGAPGDARPLRARIAAVGARTASRRAHGASARADRGCVTGIDVLEAQGFAPLAGRRVGLITNRTGRDAAAAARSTSCARLPASASPRSSAPSTASTPSSDGKVASGRGRAHRAAALQPLRRHTRPTASMLDGLDALVFDVQDAGVRFYTYVTTMAYAMEEAARRGISFFVLDRPNPINAAVVQGPVLDPDLRSFTGYFPLPVRHGMTIGELARLLQRREAHRRRPARDRDARLPPRATGTTRPACRWIAPSPNLRSLGQAALYPAVALARGGERQRRPRNARRRSSSSARRGSTARGSRRT